LKGHGNEADFLGFLHKLVRHRSLTLRFEPFRFWLRIGEVIEKRLSPARRVWESTRLAVDTIFFKPLKIIIGDSTLQSWLLFCQIYLLKGRFRHLKFGKLMINLKNLNSESPTHHGDSKTL
jgi:hypothetical protein